MSRALKANSCKWGIWSVYTSSGSNQSCIEKCHASTFQLAHRLVGAVAVAASLKVMVHQAIEDDPAPEPELETEPM